MGQSLSPSHILHTNTGIQRATRMSETKPSSELLSAIKTADSTKLKDVTPVENPAAKHDMAMFGVAKFDKNKLNSVETVEKNSLPTAEDLKDAKDQEKTH